MMSSSPLPFLLYTYYVFAVQNWAGGPYMIHGLWPQVSNTTYPTFCPGAAPYTPVSGALLGQMNTYWLADSVQSSPALWAHEWDKHGSCVQVQTGFSESAYFGRALTLFGDLEHENNTWTCGATTECIVACYDLDFNRYLCP